MRTHDDVSVRMFYIYENVWYNQRKLGMRSMAFLAAKQRT